MWVWRGMGHRLSHHVKEPLVKSKKDRQLILSQVHEDKEVEVCCSLNLEPRPYAPNPKKDTNP